MRERSLSRQCLSAVPPVRRKSTPASPAPPRPVVSAFRRCLLFGVPEGLEVFKPEKGGRQCLSAVPPVRRSASSLRPGIFRSGRQCLSAVPPVRSHAQTIPQPHQIKSRQCLSAVPPVRRNENHPPPPCKQLRRQCLSAVPPVRSREERIKRHERARASSVPFGGASCSERKRHQWTLSSPARLSSVPFGGASCSEHHARQRIRKNGYFVVSAFRRCLLFGGPIPGVAPWRVRITSSVPFGGASCSELGVVILPGLALSASSVPFGGASCSERRKFRRMHSTDQGRQCLSAVPPVRSEFITDNLGDWLSESSVPFGGASCSEPRMDRRTV